jgi:hypothetical protein
LVCRLAGTRIAAGPASASAVVIAATIVAGWCRTGAARVVCMLGLVTRTAHVLARLTKPTSQHRSVLPGQLGPLGLVPAAVPVAEPTVGRGRSGRVVGSRGARRTASVIAAAVDAGGERKARYDERHRGRANRELEHRGSFPSLHRGPKAAAALFKRGQKWAKRS